MKDWTENYAIGVFITIWAVLGIGLAIAIFVAIGRRIGAW